MMPATLRLLLPLLACLLPVSLAADERILDYRSDIRVEPAGELLVTETIRVRAEGRDIRRGIYRDFPTRYRDRWGNHVTAAFDPLAVRRNGAGGTLAQRAAAATACGSISAAPIGCSSPASTSTNSGS